MEVSPILSILVARACILASLTIIFANAKILHDRGDGG